MIRGRGASDDKGQLMTFVEACRAWKEATGSLPMNISMLFEGEEESSSPSLVPFLNENADELKSELALICDTGLFGESTPAIVTMLRGLLAEEVIITGPDKDLHSGMFGGLAMNPLRVLARIIADLHDDDGRIAIPGFYDGVDDVSEDVTSQWNSLGFSHSDFLGDVGLAAPAGGAGMVTADLRGQRSQRRLCRSRIQDGDSVIGVGKDQLSAGRQAGSDPVERAIPGVRNSKDTNRLQCRIRRARCRSGQ